MMFKVGDRVIDHLGREVQLEERASMGRFKVWLAAQLKQGKPDAEHCIILKDEEIKATQQPAGYQYLLA